MSVDQAVEITSTAVAATPDRLESVLDTALQVGNLLPHSQSSWIAIVLAALVLARLVWKKVQSRKAKK